METGFIDMIVENSNRRLDEILYEDAEYMEIHNKISRIFKKVEKLELSKKEDQLIDELLTAYNEENSCACRLVYKQGFKDCVALLKELGLIQTGFGDK